MPTKSERYAIWKSYIPPKAKLEKDIDLKIISDKYKLSGSAIASIINYASLNTTYKNSNVISKLALMEGIKRNSEIG
jgi:ATP-dependent 26S proteasome regulatory subunit